MEYSVIVPVYNEEEVIDECYTQLTRVLSETGGEYEIIFVNDGSRDATAEIVASLCRSDSRIKLVSFSRNFGQQAAITAGIDYVSGNAAVVIDCDLQDPPAVIHDMIKLWKDGYDVVYGKRISRDGEGSFKKLTSKIFYRVMKALTNVEIPVDTGEFRLMDRKVVEAVRKLREKNRFMRGIMSWVGFRQTAVQFEREKRFAGETKFPFRKMVKLALDGITSFSYIPLKLATAIGFLISIISFVYILVVIYQRLFTNTTVAGWASTVAIILFSQGIILMILGLMGEYIGRIYDELKNRPIYVVDETIGFN